MPMTTLLCDIQKDKRAGRRLKWQERGKGNKAVKKVDWELTEVAEFMDRNGCGWGLDKSYSVFISQFGNFFSEMNIFWPFQTRLNFPIIRSGYFHNTLKLTFCITYNLYSYLFNVYILLPLNYKFHNCRIHTYLVHCNIHST